MICDTWLRVPKHGIQNCPEPAVALLFPEGGAFCARHGPESKHKVWVEDDATFAWILEVDYE